MPVVTMRANLTEADIRTLIKGPTEDDRALAAQKICRCIDGLDLSGEERAHAETILKLMAEDAAASVRRALAVTLRNSPRLPHDLARQLADDIDSIALPILQHSPVLSDEDLIEIVRSAPPSKQVAVAKRDELSTVVTGAIAVFGAPIAVESALANDNAAFDHGGLKTVLQRMGDRPSITAAMAHRNSLPVAIVERLVAMVSGEVFDYLVNHHEVSPQLA
ncbi:MAG TPA: DUF2336 domain-containing protein, partial [Caulobacterales bacterium]|nr:DUF2336 domain-containing protein [Caulobacterales bacterium]